MLIRQISSAYYEHFKVSNARLSKIPSYGRPKVTTHFDDLLAGRLFFMFFLERLTAPCLSAYMPLLATDDVSGGLIGAMEPIHHMDVKNMAVSLCTYACVRVFGRERERYMGGRARERLTLGLDCGIIFNSIHILPVCVAVLQDICLRSIVIVYQTPFLIFTRLHHWTNPTYSHCITEVSRHIKLKNKRT